MVCESQPSFECRCAYVRSHQSPATPLAHARELLVCSNGRGDWLAHRPMTHKAERISSLALGRNCMPAPEDMVLWTKDTCRVEFSV